MYTINSKKLRPGLTLVELTVVIVVLLSLISALFIAANAWKDGASRGICITQIRLFQLAVRSHENILNRPSNATVSIADLVDQGFIPGTAGIPDIVCPLDGQIYTPNGGRTTFPPTGVAFVVCPNAPAPNDHVPRGIQNW